MSFGNDGLSPNGKAQDFDSCIPGSNPSSLIGYMLTFHVATYVFHTYLNPWLSDSSIWVPPFATRTIHSVKDGARPSGGILSCVYPTAHDRVTHST